MSDVETEAELMFNKKFSIIKNAECVYKLPPLSDWYKDELWQLDDFQELKAELNQTKDCLSDKEPSEWHEHTSFTHRTSGVIPALRKQIKPELLTQAWCKFYEILCNYPVVSPYLKPGDFFNSVHLCEAPGAFVTSLNHYLKLNFEKGIQWQWMANTLNPYYEGNSSGFAIMDDRFLFQTLDHWNFGHFNTGDIRDPRYIDDIVEAVGETPIHLITADGSIDCADVPEEQESAVSQLHYAEIVTSLHILARNGSLVVKYFTFFESESVCLMYLLNCVFREVHVFKPATSKSGNSEVYVICLGYKGMIDIQLHYLRQPLIGRYTLSDHSGSIYTEKALFKQYLVPEYFKSLLKECCQLFKNYQEDEIKRNLKFFEGMAKGEGKYIARIKEYCAELYISRYKLAAIPNEDRIVPLELASTFVSLLQFGNYKASKGSLNERRNSLPSRMKQLLKMENVLKQFAPESETWKHEFDTKDPAIESFKSQILTKEMITLGRKIEKISSSVLCHSVLLAVWNEYLITSSGGKKIRKYYSNNWTKEVKEQLKIADIDITGASRVDIVPNKIVSWSITPTPTRESLEPIIEDQETNEGDQGNSASVNNAASKQSLENHGCHKIVYETNSPDLIEENYPNVNPERAKALLLKGCLRILQMANTGDDVVLRINSALSRFSAGILFLLATVFDECKVSPPLYYRFNEPCLWCFKNYSGRGAWSNQVISHLERGRELVFETGKKIIPITMLEIVPISVLGSSGFITFLQNQNTVFMSRTLLKQIREELYFLRKFKKEPTS